MRGPVTHFVVNIVAGLAQAADKFDPSRGYKFSTYAYNWTRKHVVNAIQNNGRTIRLPIHMHKIMQRAKKATRELTQKHGRAPTDEEMSRTLGVPVSRVQEINDWARSTLSLDVGGGGRSSDDGDGGAEGMMDGIVFALGSKDGKDGMLSPHEAAEADMEADLLRRDLEEAFATLLPREAFVLRHRFGLAAAASSTSLCCRPRHNRIAVCAYDIDAGTFPAKKALASGGIRSATR